MAALTIEELDVEISRTAQEIKALDAEFTGQALPEEKRAEWNDLNTKHDGLVETRKELQARKERVAKLYGVDENRESEREPYRAVATPRKRVPDDPSDIEQYRKFSNSMDDLSSAYLEGALRINERTSTPIGDREKTQEKLDNLLRYTDSADSRDLARRIIATSSPLYERAFGKYVTNKHRTSEEERALSLTTTAGGYAVPYTLDPTVIIVSGGARNPVRDLARIETITGNNWIGVSSTGITASYGAEVTETSDNAPTLAQPSLNVEKAQAFVPLSIEISQDWGAVQAQVGRMFADAKNRLENTKFLTGVGHGSNEPQGLIAVGGATAVNSTATTAVLAVADIYTLRNALGQQWHDNASIVGNRAAFDKIRQFDTAGGANLWVQLQYGAPATLLGYPAYEWSAYSSALTTSGSTVLTIGDFSNFLIVDRVGMDVELIPHLFATANNRPSGQRGLYCYWRNSSAVLTPGLSANSAFQSLKIL